MSDARWDVFVSHASEDKDAVAEPLAQALVNAGLRIWYDRIELSLGDSLRERIDEGLAHSRFGIVVLSTAFFAKRWPKQELNGLVQREMAGRKVILPVWYNITARRRFDDTRRCLPTDLRPSGRDPDSNPRRPAWEFSAHGVDSC